MIKSKNKYNLKGRTLRGQAAMEYLMTYGWAILVIVIVIAALLFLNPFKSPETCLFQQPGFSCSDVKPLAYLDPAGTNPSQVQMKFSILNKNPSEVKIYKIVCTTKPIGDLKYEDFVGAPLSAPITISQGGSSTIDIPCDAASGSLKLSVNTEFKGSVAMWYSYSNDPDYGDSSKAIKRSVSATVTTSVLQK